MMGKKSEYSLLVLAYLLVALLFFYPALFNASMVVPGAGGDAYQSAWELWWVPFSIFTLHSSVYSSSFIYFPVGANLATQTLAPLAGLIMYPFQLISLQFELNLIFLLGFVLSGFFMYLLAYHITKSKEGSFVAGLIYSFAPMHVAQSFGHLQWISIEFLPMLILLLIKMRDSHGNNVYKYAILSGIDLVFVTFFGDIEQGILAFLILAIAMVYYILVSRKEILSRRIVFGAITTLGAFVIFGLPFIIPIASFVISGGLSGVNMQSGISYNELYSPDLLAFFVPSYMNPVLKGVSSGFNYIYASDPTERVAYIGYTVMALAIFGAYSDRKNGFKNTRFIIIAALFFLLLSYGPYLQVSGSITKIPGIYYALHFVPLLNSFREPGRFGIATALFLALLASFGIARIKEITKKNNFYAVFALIVLLVIVEYNAMPVQHSLRSEYTAMMMPLAYKQIGNISGNFSVLVLPALPNYFSTAPALYPGMAMFYQTAMKKPIVGGYTTRTNASEQYPMISIPAVQNAYYQQLGLNYISPFNENASSATVLMLKLYNTRFVSVIRSAYNVTALQGITSQLEGMFGNPIYVSNTTIVFGTSNALDSFSPNAPVLYAPIVAGNPYSEMEPGFELCSNLYCSASFKSMWWPTNQYMFFDIYSNKSTQNATLSFNAMSYPSQGVFYIYSNGKPINHFVAGTNSTLYSLSISLAEGFSQIAIVPASNRTMLGMNNITMSFR
ncbi:MAG: hypothetical protein ACP5RM_00955 [Candidatus Micrarchaeia archaeon]